MNNINDDFKLQSKQFGALPIIDHFLERLKLSNLLKYAINCNDKSHKIEPYKCLLLMIMNLIDGREPMYELREWAAEFSPQLLPIENDQIEYLNDDRIGRALDKLFCADRASLQTNIVLQAIREFDINVNQLHNDSTTITFTGKYKDANGNPKHGKKTLVITNGFNKDHRPDLKQILWILTVTADGAIPLHYNACDGNTTDDTTHVKTWDTLCNLLGRKDFIYVADSKLCVSETMKHISGNGGFFITVVPAIRKEEQDFRDYLITHKIQWQEEWEKKKSRSTHKHKWIEKWRVAESPLPSAEGFRIIWVWNSTKEKSDQERRHNSIKNAHKSFNQLEERLQNKRCRIRTRGGVERAADKIIKDTGAGRWVTYNIDEEPERTIRQVGKGRPGPNTHYASETITHFHVSCHINEDVIQNDSCSDGMFPLITNHKDLGCRDVLEKYKYQPRLEKRHEQLKTVYDVAPMWLNSVARIEAFLFLYFVALLIQSLIERNIRQSMKKNGLESIPIYPESRECYSPTTDRIMGIFENLHYHDLIGNGAVVQTFPPQLNEIQEQVLELLDIPVEVYQKP
ncbi:MAG: IS1634 family transposase [Thermoplasmatota archaeon]